MDLISFVLLTPVWYVVYGVVYYIMFFIIKYFLGDTLHDWYTQKLQEQARLNFELENIYHYWNDDSYKFADPFIQWGCVETFELSKQRRTRQIHLKFKYVPATIFDFTEDAIRENLRNYASQDDRAILMIMPGVAIFIAVYYTYCILFDRDMF